jgi:hypothetical protein
VCCWCCSATISVALKAGRGANTFTQNTLVQGFNPYRGMPNRQPYMDTVHSVSPNSTAKGAYGLQQSRGLIRAITPYMMATRNWAPDTEQPPTTRPSLLLSRGVLIDPTYTTNAVIYQVSFDQCRNDEWLPVCSLPTLLLLLPAVHLRLSKSSLVLHSVVRGGSQKIDSCGCFIWTQCYCCC